jgi:SAM-dependent methyltransferase
MTRCQAGGVAERDPHWADVYKRSAVTDVSWYQPDPGLSVELIRAAGARVDSPIVDVGGGASTLVDRLLDDGFQDVTVVDVAANALASARSRLGQRAGLVTWIVADLLNWQSDRQYQVWHDRAVFHFLTDAADRQRYLSVLRQGLQAGGRIVIGTFAADGPTHCSGLPTARYSADALAAEFPRYRLDRQLRQSHVTPFGTVQPFTWLVLADTPRPAPTS